MESIQNCCETFADVKKLKFSAKKETGRRRAASRTNKTSNLLRLHLAFPPSSDASPPYHPFFSIRQLPSQQPCPPNHHPPSSTILLLSHPTLSPRRREVESKLINAPPLPRLPLPPSTNLPSPSHSTIQPDLIFSSILLRLRPYKSRRSCRSSAKGSKNPLQSLSTSKKRLISSSRKLPNSTRSSGRELELISISSRFSGSSTRRSAGNLSTRRTSRSDFLRVVFRSSVTMGGRRGMSRWRKRRRRREERRDELALLPFLLRNLGLPVPPSTDADPFAHTHRAPVGTTMINSWRDDEEEDLARFLATRATPYRKADFVAYARKHSRTFKAYERRIRSRREWFDKRIDEIRTTSAAVPAYIEPDSDQETSKTPELGSRPRPNYVEESFDNPTKGETSVSWRRRKPRGAPTDRGTSPSFRIYSEEEQNDLVRLLADGKGSLGDLFRRFSKLHSQRSSTAIQQHYYTYRAHYDRLSGRGRPAQDQDSESSSDSSSSSDLEEVSDEEEGPVHRHTQRPRPSNAAKQPHLPLPQQDRTSSNGSSTIASSSHSAADLKRREKQSRVGSSPGWRSLFLSPLSSSPTRLTYFSLSPRSTSVRSRLPRPRRPKTINPSNLPPSSSSEPSPPPAPPPINGATYVALTV